MKKLEKRSEKKWCERKREERKVKSKNKEESRLSG